MFNRILGIITLKAPTYKEVAEDPNATKQAMMIVIIVAMLNGLVEGLGADGYSFGRGLVQAVLAIVVGLVTWYVAAWLLAVVAKAFGGKTDTNEMLRMTGYVAIFNLVLLVTLFAAIIPGLACVGVIIIWVVLILRLIGYVIGVREAAEFSTGNAIITALIVTVVTWVISLVGGLLSNMF